MGLGAPDPVTLPLQRESSGFSAYEQPLVLGEQKDW